jgi:hypothetical protein
MPRQYRWQSLYFFESRLHLQESTLGRQPNAFVQQQAQYHHRGEPASEKCLSAATFVRQRAQCRLVLRA